MSKKRKSLAVSAYLLSSCLYRCDRQIVARAKTLRMHAGLLPLESFVNRRAYFTKTDGGVLCNPKPAPNPFQAIVASQSDPNAMFSMLKSQIVFIILSGGVGYLISFLFSGFLVGNLTLVHSMFFFFCYFSF